MTVNLTNTFAIEVNPSLPNLLIVDGHSSRLNVETLMTAALNNVFILCLPSHLTHLLQPNDSGLNKLFKKELYKRFGQACAYGIEQTFIQLTFHVLSALAHDNIPSAIKNSFRHCGIWPIDSGRIVHLLAKEAVNPSLCSVPEVTLSVLLLEERRKEGDKLREEAAEREKAATKLGKRNRRRFFSSSHAKVLTSPREMAYLRLDSTWKKVKEMKAPALHAYLLTYPDIYKEEMIYSLPAAKRFRPVKELQHMVFQSLQSQHGELEQQYYRWIRANNVLLPREIATSNGSEEVEK